MYYDITIIIAHDDVSCTVELSELATRLQELRTTNIECPHDLDSLAPAQQDGFVKYGMLCNNRNDILREFNFSNSELTMFLHRLLTRYRKDECKVVISAYNQKCQVLYFRSVECTVLLVCEETKDFKYIYNTTKQFNPPEFEQVIVHFDDVFKNVKQLERISAWIDSLRNMPEIIYVSENINTTPQKKKSKCSIL